MCSLDEPFQKLDESVFAVKHANPTSMLYRTNRVVDKTTGKVVMETAV